MDSSSYPSHLTFEPEGIIERISLYLDATSTTKFVGTHRNACGLIGLGRLDSHNALRSMPAHVLGEPEKVVFSGKPLRLD